jgi:hypothetical protein
MKKNKGRTIFCICMFAFYHGFGQTTISVKTLLDELTDAATVAKWPQPVFTEKQASSYDRKSVAADKPGWFANGDANQFSRQEEKNGRTGFVMMDAAGPGAVVRFVLVRGARCRS